MHLIIASALIKLGSVIFILHTEVAVLSTTVGNLEYVVRIEMSDKWTGTDAEKVWNRQNAWNDMTEETLDDHDMTLVDLEKRLFLREADRVIR